LRVPSTHQRGLQDAAAAIAGPQNAVSTRLAPVLASPSRGRLVDLAQWLATCQRQSQPREPSRTRLVLVAAKPNDDDPRLVVRAEALRVALRRIDVAAFTADNDRSIDDQAIDMAIDAGIAMADAEAEAGTDLLLLALPGPPTVETLALTSVCADVEPAKVIERGAATTDPQQWMTRLRDIRDRRLRLVGQRHNPQQLLRIVGDPALAFAAGLLLQSAARRTPVVLDGSRALAAALVASGAAEEAHGWWAVSDLPAEPMARVAQNHLRPLRILDLDAANGDGSSALLSVPILREATAVPQTEPRDADAQ
jgi:nicotinate-nucleotide--dimethylbenzimidazole phosphoribosyltransferase